MRAQLFRAARHGGPEMNSRPAAVIVARAPRSERSGGLITGSRRRSCRGDHVAPMNVAGSTAKRRPPGRPQSGPNNEGGAMSSSPADMSPAPPSGSGQEQSNPLLLLLDDLD